MRLSRPPPLRSLRTFCVAAQHLSFKSAADALFVTPSAVSYQIKELEETLGLPLFERRTRAVVLTAAGQSLREQIEPLLDAIEQTLARTARRSRRRVLRVSLPPFFSSELLLPRIAQFCDRHPDIDLQIDTHDPRPEQHPPSADLSVLLTNSPPAGTRAHRLFPLALVAACAAQHAATVERLGARVFDELALLVHKSRPYAWNSWAEEIGLAAPQPKNVIELDTMPAVVRAAESGAGIALIPAVPCADWLSSGELVRVFAAQLTTNDSYFLATRAEDGARTDVAAMVDWMLATFADTKSTDPAGACHNAVHAS